ncbi:aspartate-semialdehyde dehydrogenase [Synechococcus sp. MIT S9452]|uniref:aspartate-semialdehyde dehydrogenase n=1 Tax=Synechococcus sp. MIT S9452 TaxID=3082546 RepID=UPI0039A74D90
MTFASAAIPPTVAILGATGAVGQELLTLLEERSFPLKQLRLLASPRSAGQTVVFKGQSLTVEPVSAEALSGVDVVLASAGGSVSRQWAPVAVEQGAVVIDNSSAFRMDPAVPLVVPEVNPQAALTHQGIIANPNCTTILLTLALAPLAALRPLRRVVVSTYQSASGAGARAMEELRQLSRTVLDGGEARSEVLPHSLAFNLFLHNSPLQANGYCEEELKMLNETRKIMQLPELSLSATCVRVPVLRAHSEALNIEFEAPLSVAEARAALAQAPGVELIEDFETNRFPMPTDVTGRDPVAVGRIRQDLSHPQALELWLCGDQIRKGAALNAVQIAELLLESAR